MTLQEHSLAYHQGHCRNYMSFRFLYLYSERGLNGLGRLRMDWGHLQMVCGRLRMGPWGLLERRITKRKGGN